MISSPKTSILYQILALPEFQMLLREHDTPKTVEFIDDFVGESFYYEALHEIEYSLLRRRIGENPYRVKDVSLKLAFMSRFLDEKYHQPAAIVVAGDRVHDILPRHKAMREIYLQHLRLEEKLRTASALFGRDADEFRIQDQFRLTSKQTIDQVIPTLQRYTRIPSSRRALDAIESARALVEDESDAGTMGLGITLQVPALATEATLLTALEHTGPSNEVFSKVPIHTLPKDRDIVIYASKLSESRRDIIPKLMRASKDPEYAQRHGLFRFYGRRISEVPTSSHLEAILRFAEDETESALVSTTDYYAVSTHLAGYYREAGFRCRAGIFVRNDFARENPSIVWHLYDELKRRAVGAGDQSVSEIRQIFLALEYVQRGWETFKSIFSSIPKNPHAA